MLDQPFGSLGWSWTSPLSFLRTSGLTLDLLNRFLPFWTEVRGYVWTEYNPPGKNVERNHLILSVRAFYRVAHTQFGFDRQWVAAVVWPLIETKSEMHWKNTCITFSHNTKGEDQTVYTAHKNKTEKVLSKVQEILPHKRTRFPLAISQRERD